jgi:hypothetical protein
MSKQNDDIFLPNTKLLQPPLLRPNLPLMNFFVPPPNFPQLTRPLMQQNFQYSQQRANYKPYFNFNEFSTKRNSLIDKLNELLNQRSDSKNDKHTTSNKSEKSKINV